ncbi:nuclear transport factor 2 family protein [Streptacidiphilus rugosus]|uniref:nuclear transport factor 2 family protein n=1 Tax=Streptacidiphilus rugosus TaxID=405783 RepID=UPI00056BF040|nr:nuclear transport factor 2 family protein [Streptacidiphilus rugosus]
MTDSADPQDPHDLRAFADRLRQAMESADLGLFGAMLHPDVRWGGEQETPETCHSRSDVLAWHGRLHAAGVRAHVHEVILRPHAVVLELALTGPSAGPRGPRPDRVFQVFRLTDDRIADIRGFPTRDEALSLADRPWQPAQHR